jgi:hypothetical protein
MSRRRNSWDVMRRQSRVSHAGNPAFMLDSSHVCYGTDEEPPRASAAQSYALLEQRLAEFLKIAPAELGTRITKSFGISQDTLLRILTDDFGQSANEPNPWVRCLSEAKTFNCDKVLRALLSEAEFRTFRRAAWAQIYASHINIDWSRLGELNENEFYIFQKRQTDPDFFSPYGRLDFSKVNRFGQKPPAPEQHRKSVMPPVQLKLF